MTPAAKELQRIQTEARNNPTSKAVVAKLGALILEAEQWLGGGDLASLREAVEEIAVVAAGFVPDLITLTRLRGTAGTRR